ncbi:dockerin type I domain-containing protein, partial [Ruminococcus sp.]
TITVTGGKDVKYMLGDVNNDGIINAVDASQVLKYYAKVSTGGDGCFTEDQKLAVNVNGYGVIDAGDAAKILSYYAYASTIKDGTPVSMEDFMAGKK